MNIKNIKDAPWFTLKGMFLECKVYSVYDGDTVTIIFPFENKPYKKQCRLYGINTPEIRTRNDIEKKVGYEAKEWLENKVIGEDVTVWIQFYDWDKYGRLLGTIYVDEEKSINLNDELVKVGLACSYDGGKKKSFDEWYVLKDN